MCVRVHRRRKGQSIVRSAAATFRRRPLPCEQPLAAQKLSGNVAQAFLFLHTLVERLHLVRGHRPAQLFQHALGRIVQFRSHQRHGQVTRKEAAVVFEQHQLELLEVAVRRVGVGDVNLPLIDGAIGQRVLHPHRLGGQSVGLLQPEPTVGPIFEFVAKAETQFGMLLQVADAFQARGVGRRAAHGEGVGVAEAEEVEHLQLESGSQQFAHLGVRNPAGQLQDGLLNRAGVFRVNVDGAAFECLEANEGAAQGEAALDGEATILQKLGHDLGQHLPLDVLLATDDDRTFQARFRQASGAARRIARTR